MSVIYQNLGIECWQFCYKMMTVQKSKTCLDQGEKYGIKTRPLDPQDGA